MDRPEELEFAWLMLIGISLTFLLSLAVVMFFVYYQRRLFAQRQDMEALRQEEQEKRLKAIISAQEQERSRIARDLHDEVGVMLSTVKLYLTHGKEDTSSKAQALLDDTVNTVRRIARNLSPQHLGQFGFERALDDMCEPLEQSGELIIERSITIMERLPREQEIQLHRMVQELLNNTLKHARASQVGISLEQNGREVCLRYEDNGRGMDLVKAESLPSLGLRSLSGRVEVLSGTLELQSAPGEGFQAVITMPLMGATSVFSGMKGLNGDMNRNALEGEASASSGEGMEVSEH